MPAFDSDEEKIVFEFVTEMLNNDLRASDITFATALERFGPDGVVEINCLCGFYGLIGSVLNNFDVEVPGGEKPLKP